MVLRRRLLSQEHSNALEKSEGRPRGGRLHRLLDGLGLGRVADGAWRRLREALHRACHQAGQPVRLRGGIGRFSVSAPAGEERGESGGPWSLQGRIQPLCRGIELLEVDASGGEESGRQTAADATSAADELRPAAADALRSRAVCSRPSRGWCNERNPGSPATLGVASYHPPLRQMITGDSRAGINYTGFYKTFDVGPPFLTS
jgi:hypothetical protein